MPSYVFRVGTPDGQIQEKQVQAADPSAAEAELRNQGLHVFGVRRQGVSFRLFPRSSRLVSNEKFLHFNQELAALIRAGLPIVQSFEIMLERQKNPRFRQALIEIRDKIKSGVALSDAFASFGNQFPPIYSSSLRAGERSGDLEGVIRRFLRYQKLIVNLRKKVTSALIYPSVLVVMSIAMIFVMLAFVIPKFSEFYAGFDAELPPLTAAVIDFSFLVRNNILLTIGIVVLAIVALRQWSRTALGGVAFDRVKLRIPFVGGVLHRFAMMQFTQSMGTLLAGGTPLVPAVEIATQSVTNRFVVARIEGVAQQVREGEPFWHSLERTGVLTDMAIEMIKVGESTGALVEMLANVSEFYDEEIETNLNRMISIIEPIILVVLGLVILLLLYAFYLPLFKLTSVGQA